MSKIKNWYTSKRGTSSGSVLYVNSYEGKVKVPYVLVRKDTIFESDSRKWRIFLGEKKRSYRVCRTKEEALKIVRKWMKEHPFG